MRLDKLVFLDLETTGGSAQMDRVIEVGLVCVDNGKITKTYSQLVDPECSLSPFITGITGIKDEDLSSAPTFHQIAGELFEIIKDYTFVAHNVRFDYGFLKSEFERSGLDYSAEHFCTARLSRILFPRFKRHNLDSIIKRHGIACENRHRAFDDAKVLFEFYHQLKQKFSSKKLEEVLSLIRKKTSWPPQIPKQEIEALPTTPGVYIFYGENSAPLYIGKSKNIKQRVLSHFSDDIRSSKEMKMVQQLKSIETISTAGELGALLLESDLIKKLMPVYNRLLRRSRHLILLKAAIESDGYLKVRITNTDDEPILAHDLDSIYGVFKNKRQALEQLKVLVNEHQLCRKLTGMEKTTRHCFGYSLKKCHGACINLEDPSLYNVRFEVAFTKLKFKKWPFQKPIVIKESTEDREDHFLIDRWCYLKKLGQSELFENYPYEDIQFDFDIYKILKSFLFNPRNFAKVVALEQVNSQ